MKIIYKPTLYVLLVRCTPPPPHTIYNQSKCISDPNKYKWTKLTS